MKNWKCPNCATMRATADDKIIVICPNCCKDMGEIDYETKYRVEVF